VPAPVEPPVAAEPLFVAEQPVRRPPTPIATKRKRSDSVAGDAQWAQSLSARQRMVPPMGARFVVIRREGLLGIVAAVAMPFWRDHKFARYSCFVSGFLFGLAYAVYRLDCFDDGRVAIVGQATTVFRGSVEEARMEDVRVTGRAFMAVPDESLCHVRRAPTDRVVAVGTWKNEHVVYALVDASF